jgi:hypothetical protein
MLPSSTCRHVEKNIAPASDLPNDHLSALEQKIDYQDIQSHFEKALRIQKISLHRKHAPALNAQNLGLPAGSVCAKLYSSDAEQ